MLPRSALFTGTLQGETTMAGLPPLTWTLQAATSNTERKTALLSLYGEGIVLRI
jgi:hypothetical protein